MKTIKTMKFEIKTASWGKAGSGILFICKEDGTAMLLYRSGEVMDPFVWGIPGGAIKGTEGFYNDQTAGHGINFDDETLWQNAKTETAQELYGLNEDDEESIENNFPRIHNRHPQKVIFDTNPNNPHSFKYYTFVVDIPLSEKIQMEKNAKLNWESRRMRWFPINTIMKHVKSIGDNRSERIHNGVVHVFKTHPEFKNH